MGRTCTRCPPRSGPCSRTVHDRVGETRYTSLTLKAFTPYLWLIATSARELMLLDQRSALPTTPTLAGQTYSDGSIGTAKNLIVFL
jgi:hypothetical protein